MAQIGLGSNKARVLLVDDSDELREMMRLLIGDECEVFEAHDGLEAVELVQKTQFDVIVLDESMPRLSGHETFVKLREMGSHVPVIFLTGLPMDEWREREMKAGAFDYLGKPFEGRTLLSLIDYGIQTSRRMRAKALKQPA